MKRTFYKSLDHPFELFGIKGNWVKMVLYFAGGGLIAALLLGSAFGTGFGVFILVVSIFGGFFFCLSKQKTTPDRRLPRQRLSPSTVGWVRRRETIARILLPPREDQK